MFGRNFWASSTKSTPPWNSETAKRKARSVHPLICDGSDSWLGAVDPNSKSESWMIRAFGGNPSPSLNSSPPFLGGNSGKKKPALWSRCFFYTWTLSKCWKKLCLFAQQKPTKIGRNLTYLEDLGMLPTFSPFLDFNFLSNGPGSGFLCPPKRTKTFLAVLLVAFLVTFKDWGWKDYDLNHLANYILFF